MRSMHRARWSYPLLAFLLAVPVVTFAQTRTRSVVRGGNVTIEVKIGRAHV